MPFQTIFVKERCLSNKSAALTRPHFASAEGCIPALLNGLPHGAASLLTAVPYALHFFYSSICVSTHAIVLCDRNGRLAPFSPSPTRSSVPLGLIRRG